MRPRSQSDPAVMLAYLMVAFILAVGIGIGLLIGAVVGLMS